MKALTLKTNVLKWHTEMSPANLAHLFGHLCYLSTQVCDFNTFRCCVNMVSGLKQPKNSTQYVNLTSHISAHNIELI